MPDDADSDLEPRLQPGARVLISGASFAGLATAFWMVRLGYDVTLIEAAHGLRRGGTPVDIEGAAIDALEGMGLMDDVCAKALPPRTLEFKDADDITIGVMSPDDSSAGEKYEIHRDDLLDILSATVGGAVDLIFGRSIVQLEDKADAVSVTFDDGSTRDFALVLGCDGNRSKTRRLAFGNADFSHFMGGYFFIKVSPVTGLVPADVSQIFSVPGRTALLNGYDDQTDIALAFRTECEIDYDYRDRDQQRRMIHDHFDELGWKIPRALAELDADDEFYFDRINQIRMPTWSKGRVALVGDAAYCVSPVAGMGGSMAIIGAAKLADALRCHDGDYAAAFRDYHAGLRPLVDEVQEQAVSFGMAMMFPSDENEVAERDLKLRSGGPYPN